MLNKYKFAVILPSSDKILGKMLYFCVSIRGNHNKDYSVVKTLVPPPT